METTTLIVIIILILALLFFGYTVIKSDSPVTEGKASSAGQFIGGGCGR